VLGVDEAAVPSPSMDAEEDAGVRKVVRFLADYFPVPSHFEHATSVEHGTAAVPTRC
jgi:hypothetical protein